VSKVRKGPRCGRLPATASCQYNTGVRKTVVLNVVGLTRQLLAHMPAMRRFADDATVATINHVMPAVTCSVQATYLTGKLPSQHGIVGNGWYDREDCEIKFWKQSDKLVQSPRIWEIARQRDRSFTCANLFWWYAMYSTCDVTVTPRPMYPADGRKIPDLWTNPPELRQELQHALGTFPLFKFWGPAAGLDSSEWIINAAGTLETRFRPTLTLVYIPHLDYVLQRVGPDPVQIRDDLERLDALLNRLVRHYEDSATRIVILSEYGIEPVDRPVHLNRFLRAQNLLTIREELGGELLDAGASKAFAVADHQVAHVYVNDPSKLDEVERIVRAAPGVQHVLRGEAISAAGMDHARCGDLVAVAEPGAWFTYYYWLEDARAPDFARTVDIHRKPGYDPVELFLDPRKRFIHARIGWKLLKRKLGFRALLDVIPLDANLVRGSHGRPPASENVAPIFITRQRDLVGQRLNPTDVRDALLRHVFD